MKHYVATLLVGLALVFSFAGVTDLDSLKLVAVSGDTNLLELENTSKADVFVISAAGAITAPSAACTMAFGSASSTTGSKVSVFDGGSDNKPGAIALYDDTGTALWLFVSSAGALRHHTAYPTDDDTDGSLVGTTDLSVDFDLTATGGSTGDPDFSVAGYAKLAGALEVDGAAAFDGAVTLGNAGTDVITFTSDDIQFTAAAAVTFPATAYFTQLRIGTGSADGHASVGADDLRVEGDVEIDGTLWADAAVVVGTDATVTGTATFNGVVAVADDGELTISAGGVITVTGGFHTVDTAGDGATDDLDTITAGVSGQIVVLRPEHTDRDVVVTEAGNILCGGSKTLDDDEDTMTLIYDTELSKWIAIGYLQN